MKLADVPWDIIKHYFRVLRGFLFTKNVPEPDIFVNCTIDEIRIVLGKHYFTNGWELSYSYRGEDLNMRRPDYVDDEYRWYQNHVRGWLTCGGVELSIHHELEPTEYPEEHLNNINYSKNKAIKQILNILDEEDIEYKILNDHT